MNIEANKTVQINLNLISGGPIVNHQWMIDGVLQDNNTDTLIISSYSLSLGLHDIYYKGTNYCGKFTELSQQIYTIEGEIVEKTVNILVDEPTESITVVMDYTGAVNVTVTDQLDRPVANANVSIGTITGTTDTFGKAALNNVPYGSQTLTVVV